MRPNPSSVGSKLALFLVASAGLGCVNLDRPWEKVTTQTGGSGGALPPIATGGNTDSPGSGGTSPGEGGASSIPAIDAPGPAEEPYDGAATAVPDDTLGAGGIGGQSGPVDGILGEDVNLNDDGLGDPTGGTSGNPEGSGGSTPEDGGGILTPMGGAAGTPAPTGGTGGLANGGAGGTVVSGGGSGGATTLQGGAGGTTSGAGGTVTATGGGGGTTSGAGGATIASGGSGGTTSGAGGTTIASGGSGGVTSGAGGATTAKGGAGGTGGATSSPCEGVVDSSICWIFGQTGATCAATCAPRGGTSPNVARHVGTSDQGGSLNECQRLFARLGMNVTVYSRQISLGLGCHAKHGQEQPYAWTSWPPYSDNASESDVRIVCGCRL